MDFKSGGGNVAALAVNVPIGQRAFRACVSFLAAACFAFGFRHRPGLRGCSHNIPRHAAPTLRQGSQFVGVADRLRRRSLQKQECSFYLTRRCSSPFHDLYLISTSNTVVPTILPVHTLSSFFFNFPLSKIKTMR